MKFIFIINKKHLFKSIIFYVLKSNFLNLNFYYTFLNVQTEENENEKLKIIS